MPIIQIIKIYEADSPENNTFYMPKYIVRGNIQSNPLATPPGTIILIISIDHHLPSTGRLAATKGISRDRAGIFF
jgi:hypothetical protein